MVWLVRDACGIISALFAWILLGYAQYTLLSIVLLPQEDSFKKYAHILVFELLSFLTLASHLMSVLTDPGSVPQKIFSPEQLTLNNRNDEQSTSNQQYHNQDNHVTSITLLSPTSQQVYLTNVQKCTECCSFKPDRAHHCSVCQRCIRKMDHHCPWINNCVGERNQKYFVLFTFYVGLVSLHALYLTANYLLTCLDNDWNRPKSYCPIITRGQPSPGKLIMLVFLVFEALLFSLFSFVMFFMQMRAIWTDWTGIENLKKEDRDRSSGCKSLQNVCGSHFILWLIPFTKPAPKKGLHFDESTMQKQIPTNVAADCNI